MFHVQKTGFEFTENQGHCYSGWSINDSSTVIDEPDAADLFLINEESNHQNTVP